jgi:hypothetical protein
MASIDIQESAGPRRDRLGLSCFAFHMGLGAFVMVGWLLSSAEVLMIYMVLLPIMAMQWVINRGSCIINNIETWLRTGSWRDPRNGEDGRFLIVLCDWLFGTQPDRVSVDRFSYAVVAFLWFLALGHYSWLSLS